VSPEFDPRENADDAFQAFMGMDQSQWDAMMDESHGGAFLTGPEQEGLSRAIAERIRRKQEDQDVQS
jgi:hypothetical protein